jgi:glycosyltransferase involved in cell wall biosynthesis
LGGTDGVSIESAKWGRALEQLGFAVVTVAGEGPVDHLVPGLAIAASAPVDHDALARALDPLDVVIVENLCSLPLNPPALRAVAALRGGRPTVLHHHDLAWQRPQFADDPPPDDPSWRHVTINERSRIELAERGIDAVTLYNCFDPDEAPGDRPATRSALGVGNDERVALQPTRALERKNVPGAIAVAEALGATYWLLGPAEDGYGPELDRHLAAARCPVRLGAAPGRHREPADAYAACDLVVLPSTWEGFGNPAIESAVHRRPLCIGAYPVARELAAFGFVWFGLDDLDALGRWLSSPDPDLLEHNWKVAETHFSIRDLPDRLDAVLRTLPISY